jgi:hypothetical protein
MGAQVPIGNVENSPIQRGEMLESLCIGLASLSKDALGLVKMVGKG